MAPSKRNIIEISSDSEDGNPFLSSFKIRRRSQRAPDEDPRSIYQLFEGAIPRNLIAADVAEYIQRESNARLETAKAKGVSLDDVFIGRDCLPTWINMQWNIREEKAHCAIQDWLLDLQVSNLLGNTIRERLTDLGNRKLEEARQLGLALEDIEVGRGLLPEWNPSAVRREVPIQGQPALEGEDQLMLDDRNTFGEEPANNETRPAISQIAGSASPTFSGYESLSESDSSSESWHTSDADSFPSSSSSDDEDEDGNSFNGVFSMANSVDQLPQYLEGDDEAPHILHDVEIAGGPNGHSDVDLEVYLAEDDDEAEELPEVELAINATAYAFFFGGDAAVDVRIPGMELECNLEIPSDDSYNEEISADDIYDEAAFYQEDLLDDDNEDFDDLNEDEDDQSDVADEEDEQNEDGINA